MRLWIGGEISQDVYDAHVFSRDEIEHIVNDRLKKLNYGSGLKSWDVIPIIMPKRRQIDYPEIAKYSQKKRDCEFRLYIDHAKFKKGSQAEQYRLYCDMLTRSLDYLESWNIPKFDVEQMRKDFESAVKHLDPGGAQASSKAKSTSLSVSAEVKTPKTRSIVRVIKLYKRINRQLHYHEAWVDGETIGEHWGKVGEVGSHAKHKRDRKISVEKNLKRVLETAITDGYAELEPDDWQSLSIEYKIDGMGTAKDLAKRHRLERRLDGTLGKTGMGQVDGGSIGSGTMEVSCSVVSFRLAKQIIQADLAETSFADYSRIVKDHA
jgi:hypothetical protein